MVERLATGPALGFPKSPERIDDYIAAFGHFEDWIALERPDDFLDESLIPAEHRMMADFWPEAFDTYRHAMWSYLERQSGMKEWSSAIRSLMLRARSLDPSGYEEFTEAFDGAIPRFIEQKRNAVKRYQDMGRAADRPTQLRTALSVFSDFYEIDLPLWFLAVVGEAMNTGRIDAGLLGGPASRTAQGALVDTTIEKLAGTPLESYFSEAYDAELRNAINHNDYQLHVADDVVEVRALDGSRTWSGDELYRRVTGTTQLVEAVQTVGAYLRYVEEPRLRASVADVGLVACLFGRSEGTMPHATLFQLWCFHEMDTSGSWLDSATVTFAAQLDGRERVRFTERGFTVGEPFFELAPESFWRSGWMRVTRIPIAPDLGLGYPKLELPGALPDYEMIGVADEHVVRLERAKTALD
ncbi:MAG: hypothetical protein GEU93_04140 [Propionibacteriales bacterium]|nr:hypothetical protein [Propionibacteriales bacterium]